MDARMSPMHTVSAGDNSKTHVKGVASDYCVTDVPLVQQCYSWDCGLACLSMVLQYFGASSSEVYTKDLDLQQCGESVWTVDLAYMLTHYGIPNHLCTITLGANTDHAGKAFYKAFDKDQERVNQLFTNTASNNVSVEKRSVRVEEIVDHLSTGNIAIILVDWSHMECLWCDHNFIRRSCMCCMDLVNSGYAGHFIVLCGVDKKKGVVFFKNPNAHEDLCCCRYEKLDKARKSHGTDEDILFVYPK